MTWFERITGFVERPYDETRQALQVRDRRLVSTTGETWGMGSFSMPSLAELRASSPPLPGTLSMSTLSGDARALHRDPRFNGALFQVASQFNMLEMVGPSVTPEQGVTRYSGDPTQGPACAMAAGAATIYRNYLVPVGDQTGQTRDRQLDGLADLGDALSELTGLPVDRLWQMRNGYALGDVAGLTAVNEALAGLDADATDRLRSRLRIGVHHNVEVTDVADEPRPVVSQAFCSAVPVSYSGVSADVWAPLAQLVLEAAYEATLLAGVANASKGGSNIVLLTFVGGGAFGNRMEWITAAIRRAAQLHAESDLDVRLVSFGSPSREVSQLAEEFKAPGR